MASEFVILHLRFAHKDMYSSALVSTETLPYSFQINLKRPDMFYLVGLAGEHGDVEGGVLIKYENRMNYDIHIYYILELTIISMCTWV